MPPTRVGYGGIALRERQKDRMDLLSNDMSGRTQGEGDPLVNHLKNDREIIKLEVDMSKRIRQAQCESGVFFCPHFWLCGCPCWVCCIMPKHLRKNAECRQLILRENSIYFFREEYDMSKADPAACCSPQYAPREERVFLLSEVKLRVHERFVECRRLVRTFELIQTGVSVVIDFPANGDEFIEAFERQKARSAPDIPADILQAHNTCNSPFGNLGSVGFLSSPLGGQAGAAMITQQPGSSGGSSSATKDTAGELAKLAELHRTGVLTDEEFTAAKKRLLGI